ncbi:hypothetical protein Tco_0594831 [Tanacetum coccineum]
MALDVAGEEVIGPGEVKMVMNVNEIEDCGRSSGQDHLDYEGECWIMHIDKDFADLDNIAKLAEKTVESL